MPPRKGKRATNGTPAIPVRVPLVGKGVVDLSQFKPADPIDDAIAKRHAEQVIEEWGKAFEANAEAGAPQLLAFLMAGSVYNADSVYRVALEIIASMRAGGYLILKMTELRGLIEDAVRQVREGKEPTALGGPDDQPVQFDAEGTAVEASQGTEAEVDLPGNAGGGHAGDEHGLSEGDVSDDREGGQGEAPAPDGRPGRSN